MRPLYYPSLALWTLCIYFASRALAAGLLGESLIYMGCTLLATIILATAT